MSFRLALSGINAATTDLTVTSNNIANVNTTGFKGSRAQFADLFAASQFGTSANSTGNGVRVASIDQQFKQGNINFTNNSLDLAISGSGFFMVSDQGATTYTRAGSFMVDRDGLVVNSSGQRLQAYPPLPNGGYNFGGLGDIALTTSESPPQATSSAKLTMNLASSASAPTNPVFDPADASTYNNSTSLTVYDSLGAAHTASLYFVKSANPNEWTTRLYVDGNAVGAPQPLAYSDTGVLTAPPSGKFNFAAYTPATGAAPLDIEFDFNKTTQYGSNFSVTGVTQDGFTTGKLVGVDIDTTGVVQARFTNGRSISLGKIAIANFANPQGLQQLGNSSWAETFTSGQALKGEAGNSGFGLIQSGALEASNVDITEQLVNMITAQRNFQANAQMISTSDQVTQTIINIR